MNRKIAIILTFLLLSSLNAVAFRTHVLSQGPTVVKVVPSLIEYYTDAVGQQFTVAVKIEDVTNLYGLDIKFRWNTTYLEYVSHSVRVPKDDYPDGVLYKPIIDVMDQVNTTGTYWLAKTSRWPAPTFNGSGTVFTMTFRVKKHPVQPQPTANLTLELYEVELVAIGGTPIPHIKQHGKVILYALTPSPLKHDIAITNIKTLKTIVGQGLIMKINVTAVNRGSFIETFDLTLYANTTAIETKTVTLQSGMPATLTFIWNTYGFAKGNYTLWAYARPVEGETNIEDNTLKGDCVLVTIPGDVAPPYLEVNILDVATICLCYNQKIGDPLYWPNSDVNCDGIIDIYDVATACVTYGRKYP